MFSSRGWWEKTSKAREAEAEERQLTREAEKERFAEDAEERRLARAEEAKI